MLSIIRQIQSIKIPFLSSEKLFIDLGTSMTRIALAQKGVILKEPTYLGYNTRTKDFIFFGQEAKSIVGKTPDFLKIMRPMINGVISDFDAEVALVRTYIEKSVGPYLKKYSLLKPTLQVFATYPSIATEIEQKAVEEVFIKAGCSSVYLFPKPIITAAGCNIDVFSHQPHLVADLGGGLIEIAIITGGGTVSQKTLKTAGEHMDKLIANYTYLKHGIILGETTCENLKIQCLNFTEEDIIVAVRGKSLETGLPKSVKIKTTDIKEALLPNFNQIIDSIKELIEIAPPEIVDEIYERGIYLVGGLSAVKGIDSFFTKELKIKTTISEHADNATVYGFMKLQKNPRDMQKLIGIHA